MGLIRWWKMNGDLSDSVMGASLTNSGTSTSESGKTGLALRKTSGYYLSDLADIPQNCSISMWFRHNGTTWASESLFGTRSGSSGFMFYRNSTDTVGLYRIYFWYNNTSGAIVAYRSHPTISNFVPDTWYHLTMVRDGLGHLRFYLGGELIYSGAPPADFSSWNNNSNRLAFHAQGDGSSYTGGDISFNDIRVYDHALSEKEIKELAKAKILHYRMDDFQEPTENLAYSSGQYSPDIGNLTVRVSMETLEPNKKFKIKSTDLIPPYDTGSFRLRFPLEILEHNMSYNLSYKYRIITGSAFRMVDWCDEPITYSIVDCGDHMFFSGYGKRSTYTSTYRFADFYMSSHSEVEIWDIQLEQKEYSTPFINGERSGTVYDCSGYDNHAELVLANTPQWVEESKIGGGAYKFTPSLNTLVYNEVPGKYIDCSGVVLPNDSFTLSFWTYRTAVGYGNGSYITHGAHNVAGLEMRDNFCELWTGANERFAWVSFSASLNTWEHHTFVFDRSASVLLRYYRNGVLYANGSHSTAYMSKSIQHPTRPFRIGSSLAGGAGRFFNGLMDDVRLYSTALSDEDIKELYQTRASLDNTGNLHINNEIIETGYKPLIMDYTMWQEGQSGAIGPFGLYSGGNNNTRVVATDPWGKETVVWRSHASESLNGCGIYFSANTPIDNTKLYRMSWWEKRVTNSTATYARYYAGLNGYGSTNGVYSRSNGTLSTNPYFYNTAALPTQNQLPLGEWVLVVGHVWPAGSGSGSSHPESGLYINGKKVVSCSNFVWHETSDRGRSRTISIHTPDAEGVIHYTAYPRIDICDGSEPSIQELLDGFDSRYIDYLRSKDGKPITLDIGDQSVIVGNIHEVGLPIRYIRDSINGSSANTSNHWVEIEAYSNGANIALGKQATSPLLTDGNIASSPYYGLGSGVQSVQVDLGDVHVVEIVNVRHYYADGRTYYNVKTEVSADGTNWTTIFDSNIDGEYKESSAGNVILCRPQSMQISSDGSVFANQIIET